MNRARAIFFMVLCLLPGSVTATEARGNETRGESVASGRDLEIPRGTLLRLTVIERLTSASLRRDQVITLQLEAPIRAGQQVVVRAGEVIEGRVLQVSRPGFLARRARLRIRLERLVMEGIPFPLSATDLSLKGRTTFGLKAVSALRIAAISQVSPAAGVLVGTGALARRGPEIDLVPGRLLFSCLTDALKIPLQRAPPDRGEKRSGSR